MRYSEDLKKLEQAYSTAHGYNIDSLARVVEQMAGRPLLAVGSGGSYSTASFAAFLHELHTRAVARPVTPLEMISTPVLETGLICFSASGRNRDIYSSFRVAAQREVRPLAALVMADQSPVHDLGRTFGYSDIVSYPSVDFRDGFLAVASLVAASILILRAYRLVIGENAQLPEHLDQFVEQITGLRERSNIGDVAESAVSMSSISMLHTASLKPAAVDLESRFVEAALGNIHSADLRNFGHGRHHWFAKRGDKTGILAFIGDNQEKLAYRTIDFVPETSPIARFDFAGPRDVQALAGLVVGLHVAEAAGRIVGVDPARPGVPKFGRRLYRLGPGPLPRNLHESYFEVAVRRKARHINFAHQATRNKWRTFYHVALSRVISAQITGVVFDYDGTLCDGRHRSDPLSAQVVAALAKLALAGASIGIATGRGGSAGKALQSSLPRSLWDRFIIGYYNGGVIAPLADIDAPAVADTNGLVEELQVALSCEPAFESHTFRRNAQQITIYLAPGDDPLYAVSAAEAVVERRGIKARVTLSSHSIDVVLGGASKISIVKAIKESTGHNCSAILRIGDRGRWPGNDAELLDDPLGLSVDQVNPNPGACWAFSPPGILGVQATLYYLERLDWNGNLGCLDIRPGRRKGKM